MSISCRSPLLLLLCLASLAAAEPAAVQEALRADLQVIIGKRDALAAELAARQAADVQQGQLRDLHLQLESLHRHRPMQVTIYQRGKTFAAGPVQLQSWNHGRHEIVALDLRGEAAAIRGSIRVQLNPDPWVPADGQPRFQDIELDLQIADKLISGRYQLQGYLGPEADQVTGSLTVIEQGVSITAPVAETAAPAGLAGCIELADRTALAYRQLRALGLALRSYPASYESCLERNLTTPPEWEAQSPELLSRLLDYSARLRRIAERDLLGEAQYLQGFVAPNDQRFGPFFAASALPTDTNGVPQLPAEAAAEGPQLWQFISDWTITGPWPSPARQDHLHPLLPEWIPAPEAQYEIQNEGMVDSFVYPFWYPNGQVPDAAYNAYHANKWLEDNLPKRPATSRLREVAGKTADDLHRYSLLPPRWQSAQVKRPFYGVAKSIWYARSQLHVPSQRQIWVECKADDAAQLWINDVLVWHSLPNIDDNRTPKYAIFPIDLSSGTHDLVLRVRTDDNDSAVRLLFCTRGVPQPDRSHELATQPPAAHYNFRGNGTGTYPAPAEGRPSTAVDVEKGINVLWTVPMPAFSHSYPFIVGDKIFTKSEPHWLYCFDKHTGKELWKVATSYAEFVAEEDRAAVESGLQLLSGTPEGDDPATALRAEKQAIDIRLRDERESLAPDVLAELEARSAALAEQIDDSVGRSSPPMRALRSYDIGPGTWHSFTGYGMSTPATDGTWIWTRFASGAAACYDLDGQRRWITDTGVTGRIPCVSSPVVIGDRMVIEGGAGKLAKSLGSSVDQVRAELQGANSPSNRQDIHVVVGLDAATGEKLWQTFVLAAAGGYGTADGGRGMRLAYDGGHVDVYITQGVILRASDGAVVHNASGTRPGYSGFVLPGNILQTSARTLFWAESDDQIGVRGLVSAKSGGVLAADGNLYGHGSSGVKAHNTRIPWQDLLVSDGDTGRLLHRIRPVVEGDFAYTPSAACGDTVYLTETAFGGDGVRDRALLIAVRTGVVPMVVGRSELDSPSFTGPIFDGSRMYIRTRKSLSCFQTTDEAGRDFEYQASVTELFDSITGLPLIPDLSEVPAINPSADLSHAPDLPIEKLQERHAPSRWLFVGPISDPAAIGEPAKLRLTEGQQIAGSTVKAVGPDILTTSAGLRRDLHNQEYWHSDGTFSLNPLLKEHGHGRYYFFTVLEATKPRAYSFRNRGQGITSYLAGSKVVDDKPIRLLPGLYPLVVEVELRRLPPPMMDKIKLAMTPMFVSAEDPLTAQLAWYAEVLPYQARLQEVLTRMPGSKPAFEAERYLNALARIAAAASSGASGDD